jgi:rhamnulokinase
MAEVGGRATANFLAVDLGASSGKVLLGRFDGARFDYRTVHRFENQPVRVLGGLYWDTLRLWHEITTGVRRYGHDVGEPLAGVSVDTWGVDFALLDRAGHLLGNPYHYRDARVDGIPERLAEALSAQDLYATTGIQTMPINTIYQLYSMVLAQDPQLERARTLLMTPDLFHYWLSGTMSSEYTIASTSQMLHVHERRWATAQLGELAIPTDILLPLVVPGTVIGQVRPELAADAGLPAATPVIAAGAHDTASAVASIPDLDERSAFISSGTWSLVGMEVPEPVVDETSRALNFTNEGGVGNTIRLLKNVPGLWLLQESKRQWERDERVYSWEEVLHHAARAEPFRSLIDPDAAAFQRPGDLPAAIRSYCRRTEQPEPESVGEVARCCLESLALRYRWVLRALERLTGHELRTVFVVGGGSRNDLLNQFTADASGLPVVAGPVEASALGNIMMQGVACGHLDDIAAGRRAVAASVTRRTYQPSPDAERWAPAFERFKSLLERDLPA